MWMTSSETAPAGTWPGQRTIAGTRMPPSQSVRFWPRNGRLLSWKLLVPWLPCSNVAPWSLVKTTSVSSGQPELVERVEDPADVLVEPGDHRRVGGVERAGRVGLGELAPVKRDLVGGGLDVEVGGDVRARRGRTAASLCRLRKSTAWSVNRSSA